MILVSGTAKKKMSHFQQWPGSAPRDRGKRDAVRWPDHDADRTNGTCREQGEKVVQSESPSPSSIQVLCTSSTQMHFDTF